MQCELLKVTHKHCKLWGGTRGGWRVGILSSFLSMDRSSNFTKHSGELVFVCSALLIVVDWGTSWSFICICVFVFLSLASLTLTLSQFIGPQLAKRASERTERVVNTDDSRTNPSFSSFLLTLPLPCKVKNIKTKRTSIWYGCGIQCSIVLKSSSLRILFRNIWSLIRQIFAHLSDRARLSQMPGVQHENLISA